MKIENKCKNMRELGDIDFGSVIRYDGELYLVTDGGSNEGIDFNDDSDTQMVVGLESGIVIALCLKEEFEIVKAKVVIE